MKELNIESAPKTSQKHLAASLRQIPSHVRANLQNRPGLNYGMKLETEDGPVISELSGLDEEHVHFEHDIGSPEDDWLEKRSDETPVCPVCGSLMDWAGDWEDGSRGGTNLQDTYFCTDAHCKTWVSYTFDGRRRLTLSLRRLGASSPVLP
jgi:hypothetical protein